MKAKEFVKKCGWDVARDLATRDKTSIGYLSVEHHELNQDELQNLVNAYELVESYGGLEKSRLKVQGNRLSYKKTADLWKAIELVESVNE